MAKKPQKVIAGAPDRPLVIGNAEIQCYVLEDETRVLSQRGIFTALGMSTGGSSREIGAPKIVEFVGNLQEKGIDIKDLAARANSPLVFQPPRGRTAFGQPGPFLVDLSTAVLEARDLNLLHKSQFHIATQADILIRGLATVGIIALIDEATGYQRVREEGALATILEKFIDKELQPWTKTFPYKFYESIYKLKGWNGPDGHKRPSVIGHYTNDIVYDRLARGVLDELKKRNPTLSSGRRKTTHHQWFTPDLGHPKLKEHLAAVMALMRASPNWDRFIANLNRAFPSKNKNTKKN